VVPVRCQGRDFGLLYLTGRSLTEEDGSLVHGLADAAGLMIGHLRAYSVSERRRRWLEAADDVCHLLADPVPVSRALEQVARRARSAAGARAAAVVALPADGSPVVRTYDGPPGLVADADLVRAALGPGDREVVGVGLEARLDEPVALVLVLAPGDDTELERDLLAAFADRAGLALDRARAGRDREELAVVSERERIARELHDTVIQWLFAAGLQLQTLREAPPDLVQEGVDVAVEALDAVIREIRGTVLELSPRRAAWPR
jgi:signal transduction histidine kinase